MEVLSPMFKIKFQISPQHLLFWSRTLHKFLHVAVLYLGPLQLLFEGYSLWHQPLNQLRMFEFVAKSEITV